MDPRDNCHHPHGATNIHQRRHRQTLRLGLLLGHPDTGEKSMGLFEASFLTAAAAAVISNATDWNALRQMTSITGQILQTIAAASGLGNHAVLLSPRQEYIALKWSFFGQVPLVNGIGFGKLAVIAFLLQIQDRRYPRKRWLLYFVGVSGCVVNLITIILLLLQCYPMERQWKEMSRGACPHFLRTRNSGYLSASMLLIHGSLS